MPNTFSPRPQKVAKIGFKQGVVLDQLPFQPSDPVSAVLLTFMLQVVISAKAGSISPAFAGAPGYQLPWDAPGFNAPPAYDPILNLCGQLSFYGNAQDGSKGLHINNIPFGMLYLDAVLNGDMPTVYDGGMAAAAYAAGTYNVFVQIPLNFGLPRVRTSDKLFSYFRPVRYNNKPYFQIQAGNLFQAGSNGQTDLVAAVGETTTPATLAYAITGTVTMSIVTLPGMNQAPNDQCGDRSFEYVPIFDASQSDYNNINLSDNGFQDYFLALDTALYPVVGGEVGSFEACNASLGTASQGDIETYLGTKPLYAVYPYDLHLFNTMEFPPNQGAIFGQLGSNAGTQNWPGSVYVVDECGRSLAGLKTKTLLAPGTPQHLLDLYGVPGVNGSNLRVFHSSLNLSKTAEAALGTPIPPFAGVA